MNFGTKLRNLRVQRGLSQYQLGKAMGIPQTTIAAYEVNRNEPRFSVIQEFADFFHVSPYFFLPFGDIFSEDENAVVGEIIQGNPKLSTLFNAIQNFSDADLDTLITVANSLRAKYGE